MMIWKISQDVNKGYDTYSEAVVIAADELAARHIHPDGAHQWREGVHPDEPGRSDWAVKHGGLGPRGQEWITFDTTWAPPGDVKVTLIGVATGDSKPGVVCASFHAG